MLNLEQSEQDFTESESRKPIGKNVYTKKGDNEVIWFQDVRHKLSRSRKIAGFHTPAALREMLSRDFYVDELVTREEFDIQAQVLARTREKLAKMEARMAALESPAQP